ncbi:ABC transporter permease [Microbacterium sp. ASV49]|uniref:ABC transporter permease n=1 Tax=Microbacterium candidum TaxID=3041922 RepID=A0ABT7N0X8_9MICO|nr:FtsX-like permease family protein [Microbacterium sp. ASV49]MDL9980365.1 ABC transporter permease [Microbacterium sp. ASV49]
MSAIVGALAEAWAEVRHHKLRVLLSLIGIALAVGAIAAVVAFSEYQKQAMAENSDREGGRQATLSISAALAGGDTGPGPVGPDVVMAGPVPGAQGQSSGGPSTVDWDGVDAAFARVAERYGFSHTTRVAEGMQLTLQTPDQVRPVQTRLIDPDWTVIHRAPLKEGRWLRASDAELLAPAVVISQPLWEAYGSPDLAQHPTITITGDGAGVAQVVGVTPKQGPWDDQKTMVMLYDAYRSRVDQLPAEASVHREVWVPPAMAREIGPVLAMDMRAAVGTGTSISVSRTDWGSRPEMESSMVMFELVAGGIAGLVLLLGGLGLVNIQLVAMRQRIREIGIRRSFGATAGRIFTTVLLESVVATAVAGVFGIALAVVILRMPFVMQMFPMQDVPPFPLRAAFTALIAAVAIGALAGFIPALTAVRSRVIDALRF